MNQNYVILITVIAALAIFIGATYFAVKRVKSNKTDIATLDKVSTGITYAQAIAKAINPFLPSIADNVIDFTLDAAQKAIMHEEAIYKAATAINPAANDMRKVEATSLIKSALTLQGIPNTPQIDKLIDTVIPLLVLALPKTHEAVPTATTATTATV